MIRYYAIDLNFVTKRGWLFNLIAFSAGSFCTVWKLSLAYERFKTRLQAVLPLTTPKNRTAGAAQQNKDLEMRQEKMQSNTEAFNPQTTNNMFYL